MINISYSGRWWIYFIAKIKIISILNSRALVKPRLSNICIIPFILKSFLSNNVKIFTSLLMYRVCRYHVRASSNHIASIQLKTSRPDVYIKLQVRKNMWKDNIIKALYLWLTSFIYCLGFGQWGRSYCHSGKGALRNPRLLSSDQWKVQQAVQ